MVVQRRMPTDTIIKDFDILKNSETKLSMRLIRCLRHKFSLESCEKTLSNRIVKTVAFATHTLRDLVQVHLLDIVMACVLRASVRMMNQRRACVSSLLRHVQGIHTKRCIDSVAHGMPNHLATIHIKYHSQVQKALLRFQIRDVRHPHFPRCIRVKLLLQKIGGHPKRML